MKTEEIVRASKQRRPLCNRCGQPGHYRVTCPNADEFAGEARPVTAADLRALENRIISRIAAVVGGRRIGAAEAAEICGVSSMTIRRWAKEGRVASVAVGGKLLIELASLPSSVASDEAIDGVLSAARARGGAR